MKQLFTIMLILCAMQSFSQQYYHLVNSDKKIEYLKSSAGSVKTITRIVPVEIEYGSSKGTINLAVTLNFAITATAIPYHPTLITKSIELPAADFSDKASIKEVDLEVSIDGVAGFTDAGFTITMNTAPAAPASSVNVRMSKNDETLAAKTKYDGLKPFWIELGTNLDLVDGPKPSNFTAGVFYHKFDHRWGKKGSNRWASFAGAYEAKIVSNENNLRYSIDSFVSSRSFIPGKPDTIKTFTYAGKAKQTQTLRNWSFFYSPAIRLGKGSYNDGNFHLYASFWAELRYQEVQTNTDNSSLILIDSSRTHVRNIANYKQSDDTLVRSNAYTHYFGAGLPIYIETAEDKGFSFLLNPVFGLTNQPTAEDYDSIAVKKLSSPGNPHWHPFYFVQFRLSDKEFGLTVTGEVRGLLIKHSPPQYTIALTKKFNLKKLIYYNSNE